MPRKSRSVGRSKEAVCVIFGWVQANVKMAVSGRNGVAIRNSEKVLPCDEVMVARIEQHSETIRAGAHTGSRNFLAIASRLVASAASERIGPSRFGVVGASAIRSKTASRRSPSAILHLSCSGGQQVANPPASVSEVLPGVTKGLRSKGDISPIGIFAGLGTQVYKMALKGPARSPSEGEAPFPLGKRFRCASLPSVAVLPFESFGGYFTKRLADGLNHDLTTDLASFPEFHVLARKTTAGLGSMSGDPRELGGVLHADYLIEGSIQHDADVVRIAARLVDASNGAHRRECA